MSDPMTTSEIEDVLSSIRRLVAAEAAGQGARTEDADPVEDSAEEAHFVYDEAPEADVEETADGGDALVLTSSQRVDLAEPAGDAADAWEADAAQDQLGSDDSAVPEAYADVEAATDATDEEWESEHGDATAHESGEELPSFFRAQPDTEEAARAEEEATVDDVSEEEPVAEVEPEAEAEPSGGSSGFFFASEPAEGPTAAVAPPEPETEPYPGFNDAPPEFAPSESAADVPNAEEDLELAQDEPDAELSAFDAKADEAPSLDEGETSEEAEGAAETTELAADAPEDEDDGNIFDDADGDVLDEEALREMIVEIVHQELTGSLGERITRNVRKLVRREVHRALASRDFD